MVKLNRTSEYGLIALKYMGSQAQAARVTSAREVADRFKLPFEITAKTLQRLKEFGLIQSAHGARGGYTLNCKLEEVTLGRYLKLMEGPQALVNCMVTDTNAISGGEPASSCEYGMHCELKSVMGHLNQRVVAFLEGIKLSEITGATPEPKVYSIVSIQNPTQAVKA